MTQRPLPRPSALTQPHWEGCLAGELRVQRCRDCGAHLFIPQPLCSACFGGALEWVVSAGHGTVYSFTIVHRAAPGVPTPYVSATVDLEGGGSVKTNLVNIEPDPDKVQLGMPVHMMTFVAGTDDDGTEAIAFGFERSEG